MPVDKGSVEGALGLTTAAGVSVGVSWDEHEPSGDGQPVLWAPRAQPLAWSFGGGLLRRSARRLLAPSGARVAVRTCLAGRLGGRLGGASFIALERDGAVELRRCPATTGGLAWQLAEVDLRG